MRLRIAAPLAAAFASLLIVACGPIRVPSGGGATGLVTGHVYLWPTCPVERVGQVCRAPMPNARVDLRSATGSSDTIVTADGNGYFSTELPVGRYQAEVRSLEDRIQHTVPLTFAVYEGRTTDITVLVDTGLR